MPGGGMDATDYRSTADVDRLGPPPFSPGADHALTRAKFATPSRSQDQPFAHCHVFATKRERICAGCRLPTASQPVAINVVVAVRTGLLKRPE